MGISGLGTIRDKDTTGNTADTADTARPAGPAAAAGAGAAPPTHATAVMLAAANYYWHEVLDAIDARRAAPCRAPAPELGLDVDAVRGEALRVRRWAIWFDVITGIAALAGIWFAVRLSMPPSFDAEGWPIERNDGGYLALAWLVIAALDFVARRRALSAVRRRLRTCTDCARSPAAGAQADGHNVTVSGGYTPFVGAGLDSGGWSFTVNLLAPEHEGRPVQPATVADLYDETGQALRQLDLSGMAPRDEIFIDGRDVRDLPFLMPDGPYQRPRDRIEADRMAQFIGNNDPAVRHYKVIRLQLWGGEVVLSHLFRYVIQAGTLYVEARSLVLPPLADKYLALQNLPQAPVPGEAVKEMAVSLARGTVMWIPVLLKGLHWLWGGFAEQLGNRDTRRRKRNCREIAHNQQYNYGWSHSLREAWSGTVYSRYFQMIDKDFYGKLIRETLLDSLLKSLERRNICTSGLKEASTRIYNEGIIVSGGTVQAESMAAGKGARATVEKAVRAVQGAAAQA